MANVVHLWNPRSARRLRRHWVSFFQHIAMLGSHPDDRADLQISPVSPDELRVCLRSLGVMSEKSLHPGEDIEIHMRNAVLFIDVKAIGSRRLLVEFASTAEDEVRVVHDPVDSSILLTA